VPGVERVVPDLQGTALIAGNLGLILVNRSWSRNLLATARTRNRAAWAVVAGAAVTLVLTWTVPFLQQLFRFGPVSGHDLALATGAGLVSVAWFEVLKAFAPGWVSGAAAGRG